MTDKRIGLRDIRKLSEGETIWDGAVSGFGARRQKGKSVTYILKYRTTEGRQRWFSIGRHGSPWTPDEARDEAVRLLGEVKRKADPAAEKIAARNAATISELCDLYLADAQAGRLLTRRQTAKRPSTLATDKGRIEAHIKPLLGRMAVAAVTRQDIDAFLHDIAAGKTARKSSTKARKSTRIRGGKGAATRTVGLLGSIFTYAVRHRMRADNPARGVVRFADGQRERRLSDAEYKALGDGLRNAEAANVWPAAIVATRLLALTGWRSAEALGLRWDAVDLARRTAILAETKSGKSMRPLSRAACDLLRGLSNTGDFVFPATRGERGLTGFPQVWARKIAPLSNLPSGVTPHTLRHSFASLAGDMGYSETTIAALIGHKGRSITSRYVHSADAVLLAAADAVAIRTAELMGDAKASGDIIHIHRVAS
jgi:integrase